MTWAAPLRAKCESRAIPPRRLRQGAASRCRSYYRQLALLRSGCCVFECGEDILAFQVGVVDQQLVDAGAGSKLTEHRGRPIAAMSGLRPERCFTSTSPAWRASIAPGMRSPASGR
jgi:hypothetical protein